MMMQNKFKMTSKDDNEEGNGVDINNCNPSDENGCSKGDGGSIDLSVCIPDHPEEDHVGETSAELRPLKKSKSEPAENCCSSEVDNGWSLSYHSVFS